MSEYCKVLKEKTASIPEERREQIYRLLYPLEIDYHRAKSKMKKIRCAGDINAVLNEYCLDMTIVE